MVGPTDGPETEVTTNLCHVKSYKCKGLNNMIFKVSTVCMLRIEVFWVVTVNSRVINS
jgi:hypothetical protein